METHASAERIAQLEAALPALAGWDRATALAELGWHLRERDSRRAHSFGCDAITLASVIESPEAALVRARAELVCGECALLFRDVAAARACGGRALRTFQSLDDRAGVADAHLLRARLARAERDLHAAQREALAARRAAEAAEDACRRDLADAACASLVPPRGGTAAQTRPEACEPAALAFAYIDAHGHIQQGSVEAAVEMLVRVALEAPALGMDELAMESELAIARIHGALGDIDHALERVAPVLAQARIRGWRGLLASATASACDWLLATNQASRAVELLREARASLGTVSPLPGDAWLERLLGEAELASGDGAAATTLSAAAVVLAAHGDHADVAITLARQSRAHAATGDIGMAQTCANDALAIAREARSRFAEMEALAALASLHTHGDRHPTDMRSAIAFLRHAAEIAGELDDAVHRAEFLRELSRLHESCADLGSAIAAERGAVAQGDRAQRHRAQDLALSARARAIAERVRLEHDHAAALQAVEAKQANDIRAAYDALERLRLASAEVMSAADAPSLVAGIERSVAQLADIDLVALYRVDAAGRGLTRYARERGRAIPVRDVPSGDMESYAARAARERREIHVEVESARPGGAHLHDYATLWFAPVVSGDEVLGVLTLQSRAHRAYGEREKIAFRSLCGHAAVALENARLREALRAQRELRIETEERLRRVTCVDALTGLATRAHFFSMARERLERARRDGGPCGVIIADIDAFKSINDVHGHAAGDRALAAVASTIAAHLHGDDVGGRIGGEEFAVLLPGATLEATVAAAERMRDAAQAQVITHDGAPLMVTMSFGCTAIADAATTMADKPAGTMLERMVRDADAALYEAQGTGGNRAIAWPAYEALRELRFGQALASDPQSFA